ncbi:MAG: hypothetical protein Q9180_002379 [Flavoplaca navasiana]
MATVMQSDAIELETHELPLSRRQNVTQQVSDSTGNSINHEGVVQQLKPADGGIAAWKVLFAAFMFEAMMWGKLLSVSLPPTQWLTRQRLYRKGFSVSFGVFQNYYSKLPEFHNDRNITIIGTMASGVPYLGAPFMAIVVRRYQRYRQYMIWIGWPICVIGLLASSFSSSVEALIVTQGLIYGFGFLIIYWPIISFINEWWIHRRGMAFGVITCAAGVSGIAMPFIIESLLERYGYRITLRAVAVGIAILTGPLIPFLKGRLPPSQTSVVTRQNWSFARSPLFWVYSIANIAQGLGFFFPSLFLPSYATSIGLSARQGALLLALMSFAQVLGQFSFGLLSDKVNLNNLLLLSTMGAAVATFTAWGFARDFAPLIVFALLFGFFAYGFNSLPARMGTAISEDPTVALATFSVYVVCQGFGNVLAGPISAGLLTDGVRKDGYGAWRYKTLVLFTGGYCSVHDLTDYRKMGNVTAASSEGIWLHPPLLMQEKSPLSGQGSPE